MKQIKFEDLFNDVKVDRYYSEQYFPVLVKAETIKYLEVLLVSQLL